MIKGYRIFLILLAISMSLNIEALLLYEHLESPIGKPLLILGEDHYKDDDLLKGLFKLFLQAVTESPHKRPLPLIIEYPEDGMPVGAKLESSNISYLLANASQNANKIRLIPYDPRSVAGIAVHSILRELGTMIVRGMSIDELCEHYAIKTTQKHTVSGQSTDSESWEEARKSIKSGRLKFQVTGTIAEYVKSLDDDFDKLAALVQKHQGNKGVASLLQQKLETFDQARSKIKAMMGKGPKRDLATPILTLFADAKTVPQRLTTYGEWYKLIVRDTDEAVADCHYLDRLLSLNEKEPATAILVGYNHAQTLADLCSQLGYKRISTSNGRTLNYPLLTTVDLKPEFCIKLIAAAQKVLIPLQKVIIADNACHGCLKEFTTALQACSRCKEAKYCGKECQTMHWSQHKISCKEQKKVLHTPSEL